MLSVVVSVLLFVALIAVAAWKAVGPHRPGADGRRVKGVTMAVLAIDVMTGSPPALSSLMGWAKPVVWPRFCRDGQCHLRDLRDRFACSWRPPCRPSSLRHGPKLAAIIVALIGVGTRLVDGAPFWGADGGSPPAASPGHLDAVHPSHAAVPVSDAA